MYIANKKLFDKQFQLLAFLAWKPGDIIFNYMVLYY